ncbi:MAG: rod shape-determining protein RodA [bacterium]
MKGIPRKYTEGFNWPLATVVFLLLGIGLVNLYSAVYFWGEGGSTSLFWSQLVWSIIGVVLMFFVIISDYRVFQRMAVPFYAVVCVLLVLSIIMGSAIRGTHGWLKIGPFTLQPAEFAKIAYILIAAKFFSDHPSPDGYSLTDLWRPGLAMLVPFALIIMQGDLGTSLFLILIFISLAMFAKVRRRTLIACAIVAIIAAGGFYTFGLKEYQRNRIFSFFNPEADVRGSGYHLVQSKIAVGSGKLFGKGYLKGNINKLRYLPERHTDFIFPVFAEEWGFVGSIIVLSLYTALLMMGIEIASKARDRFGAFVAMGVVALLFWQITINLGGVLGLMPLTGVTLPLMSYGGSSMVAILVSLGMLFSIHMKRFMF